MSTRQTPGRTAKTPPLPLGRGLSLFDDAVARSAEDNLGEVSRAGDLAAICIASLRLFGPRQHRWYSAMVYRQSQDARQRPMKGPLTWEISGADDGIRTRDPHLGKVML